MATETGWLVDDDAPGPRKPLYVRGGPGLRVEVDGPALRVRRPMQAAVLFPLARVGRCLLYTSIQGCPVFRRCLLISGRPVFVGRKVRICMIGNGS